MSWASRFVSAVLLAFTVGGALAALPTTTTYTYYVVGGPERPTVQAAAEAFAQPRGFVFVSCGAFTNNGTTCNFTSNGTPTQPQQMFRFNPVQSCPANSTLSGSTCTCNTNFTEFQGQCVASSAACVPGELRTFNRTTGWGRTASPDGEIIVDYGLPPQTTNDGVCNGELADVVDCWRSQEPSAQGLYRLSCDFTMRVTSAFTSGTPDNRSDPLTPDATCPGFVGEVNGKTVCVGTASAPLPAGAAPPAKPTRPGNPTAGVKPETGEGAGTGAGRTPSTGNGGNLGGPASAAVGPSGTGTRDPGDPEQGTEVCGAPPLPACNVKVDETGTPGAGDASGRFTEATSALDAQTQALEGVIDEAAAIDTPGWSWSFSMPTGCTALQMPAFDMELDVCQFQPMIHDLMSFVWVIAGFFAFLGLFRNATTV